MTLPFGYAFHEHRGNELVVISLQDFLPRLKAHLLPCILEQIWSESENPLSIKVEQAELKHIILGHDRMYMHKIIMFNYMTYDMRWDQDVLNPGTSYCNFMALAQPDSTEPSDEHPFLYSQILGVFHVNVIYNGPGMTDYNPRRYDFLWVRWYDLENSVLHKSKTTKLKASHRLNHLVFPSLDEEDSVGFLDPADVLRGCHIIPAFAQKKCFSDSKEELSKCAHEDRDWNVYYIFWQVWYHSHLKYMLNFFIALLIGICWCDMSGEWELGTHTAGRALWCSIMHRTLMPVSLMLRSLMIQLLMPTQDSSPMVSKMQLHFAWMIERMNIWMMKNLMGSFLPSQKKKQVTMKVIYMQ